MRALTTALAASLGAALAAAASLGAQTVAITGGTVYPVSGPRIENGTVLIRDGRIVAVGQNVAVPAGAERIDATGKWVTPGLFNAATTLGVVEVGAVGDTRDVSAAGTRGIAASFTVWEGFNPASVLLAPARNEGVTTVGVVPAGGLISGQLAIVDLVPDTSLAGMIRGPSAGMVARLTPPGFGGAGLPQARGEMATWLRELLTDVRAYSHDRAAYDRNQTRELSASRADLEALIPVLEGRLPLIVAADRASDIDLAMRLAEEFDLRIMIAGGAEAWQRAGQLAARRIPVLTGAMNNIPGSFSSLGTRQENVGLLRRAGVPVIIIGNAGGDEESFNVRNIRYEAGNAVAYGATWDDALRAVTLAPAEAFGVADRVGSLQPGRDANVVVWSGDPFEFATEAEQVLIRGRSVKAPTRQEMLMQRYRTLPPSYGTPRP